MTTNKTGSNNTAVGINSLSSNINSNNTAIGFSAGLNDVNGSNNTYLGSGADIDVSTNTYTQSTAIGYNTKINASNQIMIGTTGQTVTIPGQLDLSGNMYIQQTNYSSISNPYQLGYSLDGTATSTSTASGTTYNDLTRFSYFDIQIPAAGVWLVNVNYVWNMPNQSSCFYRQLIFSDSSSSKPAPQTMGIAPGASYFDDYNYTGITSSSNIYSSCMTFVVPASSVMTIYAWACSNTSGTNVLSLGGFWSITRIG
jgi:hypothetical protein